MAQHDIAWDVTNFDSKPTGTSLLGQVDEHVRNTRQAVRERFKPEHNFDMTNDDMQGKHKMGSARAWIGSALYPNLPASPEPVYTDEEDEAQGGRVFVNLDTAEVQVHGDTTIFPAGDGQVGAADSWVKVAAVTAQPNSAVVRDDDGHAFAVAPVYNPDEPSLDSPSNTLTTKDYVEARIAAAAARGSWPVGSVYVQFPSQSAPAVLWPESSTKMIWTDVTSVYAGAFFRAEGGLALNFGAGMQGEMIGRHTHTMARAGRFGGTADTTVGGDGGWTTGPVTGTDTDRENRPANYSIRIWKRTT